MEPIHSPKFEPGLYDQLLGKIDQQRLAAIGDPRLYSLLEVDPEERHAVMAQFLERLLSSSLSLFRGKDVADRQRG